MILENLKKANIEAIKNHDSNARALYSVLLNKIKLEEINRRQAGQELKDADVATILQKASKELNEEKANYEKVNNSEMAGKIAEQIALVESYLPKMLTEGEIRSIISSLSDKTLPNVMKHFKQNYQGACDMRLVSDIAKGMQ